jgi:hypothetical protein
VCSTMLASVHARMFTRLCACVCVCVCVCLCTLTYVCTCSLTCTVCMLHTQVRWLQLAVPLLFLCSRPQLYRILWALHAHLSWLHRGAPWHYTESLAPTAPPALLARPSGLLGFAVVLGIVTDDISTAVNQVGKRRGWTRARGARRAGRRGDRKQHLSAVFGVGPCQHGASQGPRQRRTGSRACVLPWSQGCWQPRAFESGCRTSRGVPEGRGHVRSIAPSHPSSITILSSRSAAGTSGW